MSNQMREDLVTVAGYVVVIALAIGLGILFSGTGSGMNIEDIYGL